MKKTGVVSLLLAIPMWLSITAQADVITDRLAQYRAEGAGYFVASQGKEIWFADHEGRNCTQCHGETLTMTGKHIKTGKLIEPMAPSINPERLTNADTIEKWFLRNCKWTIGRACTPQEKGNILVWLKAQ